MTQYTPLINILVAGFGLAFVFGFLAHKLRISPVVGYLLAGVVIGPSTPGYTADPSLAAELAEIGVILLMFGVGLHFSLQNLKAVKNIAIPGAIIQMIIATLLGMLYAHFNDWPKISGLVFGLALSVASTVVLLRSLQGWQLENTKDGKIAVGWLIVEDLAVVLILVLLPSLANLSGHYTSELIHQKSFGRDITLVFFLTVIKASTFIALMMIFGRRYIPRLLYGVARSGSNELFRLAVLAIALVVAFIASNLFGVSFSLGAFFAGMFLNESTLSNRAARETLPLRDAFAVLFFVSVGMLLRPEIVIEHPFQVLMTATIIIFGKSLTTLIIVLLFRYPLYTALIISAGLAQIGEFSFMLASLSFKFGLITEQAKDLLLAGAFISIIINPLFFSLINRFMLQKKLLTQDNLLKC